MLSAQNLSFAYQPEKTILHDVSLKVQTGEVLYILGPNGVGKTTLLHILAGLLTPDTGHVFLADEHLEAYSAAERAKLIGLIPQLYTPVFAYTIKEMVIMGRAPHLGWLSAPSKPDVAIVDEALEQVGLYELRDRAFTSLSGGERQLALIARGLAQKCSLLLMDEPTAHLDLSNQHRILEIINQLSDQGLSFIISSHSPNDALAYADNVVLLSGGWVTEYGPPKQILTEPNISSVYGIKTEVIFDWLEGKAVPKAVVPRRPLRLLPGSLQELGSPLNRIYEQSQTAPQLLLVTGLSGAGKTTWCLQLSQNARAMGLSVAGILSPGIYEGKQKIGIGAKELLSGEERPLARLREDEDAELATPRWAFDADVLEWANQKLASFPVTDLLIIDELGPLEFLRGEGLTQGLSRIDAGNYRLACVVIRSSLLPKALQRWPNALVVEGGGSVIE
ncbi:MAG TPA: ATP-binding cassette domain-containing protein [Brevefilum fermentans]|jgi:iron complex transport system ATP-binding protein|uniref:Iron(III) ABC transporter, ATP-binding protein (Modular protein) n=1 Tax=Candidatus Brevifilum fermentans TaxID=1986204 RepID=A0A1Y6K4H3_9CHLR|nr:ATP-binding cassette domain-containing protein [Brevefilum fermentans]MDI9565708.1 ATP-binding cassette domain-containing protein [Chloroflexota bacterium]SMX54446.1 Iron(III) ABC transporter, ATP-binding protein (modular protein) [Brevefilum fermentans]HQA28381.1 ATP-binding cassette domain-containing protein [Brevefilum fermentans]